MEFEAPESIEDAETGTATLEEPQVEESASVDDVDGVDETNESDQRDSEAWKTAQKNFEAALSDAEDNLIEASLREEECAGELKAAKNHRKGCLETLQRVKMRGVEGYYLKPQSTGDGDSDNSDDDNSWRIIPTEDVVQGVEKLGSKKLDALLEAYPTLGDLEDARGDSGSYQHFSEKLPKGFGENLADAIENRMIEVIAKHGLKAEQESSPEESEDDSED